MKWINVNIESLPGGEVLAKRSFPGKIGGEELMVGTLKAYYDVAGEGSVFCKTTTGGSRNDYDGSEKHTVYSTVELWGITHYILWRDLIDLETDGELPVQQ